jgi:hypothetical protein
MSSELKPTRPQKVKLQKPKATEVSLPEGLEESEIAKPTSFDTNKYAPKPRIGRPTLGSDGRVTKVGLGGLTTTTIYGNPDV